MASSSTSSRAHNRLLAIAQHVAASPATPNDEATVVSVEVAGETKRSSNDDDKKPLAFGDDMRNGGKLAAQAFVEQGVKHIFTLTGGHIAPILVGSNQAGIKVIDVRDEATTVFAADAMARITGIPGVAVVTAGPGLTNTITAVKNAQLAQSPVIVCAGATAIILKGRGSLQDIDQFALMKPHVKKMFSIQAVRQIIPAIREAFAVAQEGVPGPVFIEFPIETLWPRALTEMQIGAGSKVPKLEFNAKSLMAHAARLYIQRHVNNVFKDAFAPVAPLAGTIALPQQPLSSQVEIVARALMSASRPVFLIGSQAVRAQATEVLRSSLESLNVPVYLSGMGRGLLGKSHPLQMRHKRAQALAAADFVLLAGVPADFRLDYGRHINIRAFFATVNLCRTTLNKNNDARRPNVKVLGDSVAFIKRLAETIGLNTNKRPEWRSFLEANEGKREKEIDAMAAKDARREHDDDNKNFIGPIRLCRELDAAIGDDSIIVADGGDFVGTASYIVKPRGPLTWLDPGVFGTLGVGGGFALAAKCAKPKSEVWILYGDGASGWGLAEFDTYVRHGLPVIAVIGNDACWSQMYRDQIRLLKDPVATELAFTHYETVAEGFGAKGILVRKESQIASALAQAKQYAREGHPVIVNCLLGRSAFREGSISL